MICVYLKGKNDESVSQLLSFFLHISLSRFRAEIHSIFSLLMSNLCRKELLYAIIVALGPLSFGLTMGFTSPVITEWTGAKTTKYQNWDVFSTVSNTAITWFNAISSLFGCVGPFIAEYALQYIARRPLICICCASLAVIWACHFAISPKLFYFGIFLRALVGLSVGAISAVCPVMLIELSPPGLTGFFGSLNQVFIVIGIVWMNLQGNWQSWKNLIYTGLAGAILPCFLIWLCPETYKPSRQIRAKNEHEDPSDNLHNDLETLEANKPVSIAEWENLSKVLIGIVLMFIQQFAGVNALITNLDQNFLDAGVSIDPGVASAMTSSAQLISCLIFSFLIDRGYRRKFFIASSAGCGIFLIIFAFNSWWHWASWLPIVIIFLYMFCFCIAMGPYPWYCVCEQLHDPRLRIIGEARIANFNWLFSFLIIFLYPALRDSISNDWTQIVFAVFAILGSVYAHFYIKEPESEPEKH